MAAKGIPDMKDGVLSIATLKSLDSMTEEEFVQWCDEDVRAEYVYGKVIVMSPESVRDERMRWFIGSLLRDFVEYYDLGEIFGPNLQIRLQSRLRRIPDLMFIAREHLHQLRESHFEGAPDLAMEIVSSDSRERDEQDKYQEYEAFGIREYWIIAPLTEQIDVYRLTDHGTYEPLLPASGVYHSTVIPGFFLNSQWLRQQPPPKKRNILREFGIL
ncbi:MAG: Uma2 family endonuclease [Candidatus Poribacteria bacterium]|nr:Uma2 family endonuclease [Candidatus Poribacteria bacterium]